MGEALQRRVAKGIKFLRYDSEGVNMSNYIIKVSNDSCHGQYGSYKRIAILEVEDGVTEVSMISERARGVIRIVEQWNGLNVGKTDNCAFAKGMEEAEEMLETLRA